MEIRLDFIPAATLAAKDPIAKMDFILERIKRNVIIVLEEGLSPREEAELIAATMREIDARDFHGIEFYRLDSRETRLRERIANYISGKKSGLTIVGPTRMVEAIKKEPDCISMLAKAEAECPTDAPSVAGSTKGRKRS